MESGEDRGGDAPVLDSWKAIAAYLNRDVSTVQRWEHGRGLPVHRLPGGKKGGVYALGPELDAWRRNGHGEERSGNRRGRLGWVVGIGVVGLGLGASLTWMIWAGRAAAPLRFRPLMSLAGEEVDPSFSSDGGRAVFSYRPEGAASFDLYMKPAGEGEPRRLTRTAENERFPQWSPDGRRIAFLRQSEAGMEAWVMAADGGGQSRVAMVDWQTTLGDTALAWSKTGEGLIVPGRAAADQPVGLSLVDIATGKKSPVTQPPAGTLGDAFPRYSPDWKELAFLRQGPSRVYEVWVRDGGGRERRVTSDGHGISGLVWSRDGEHLMYVSSRGGPDPAIWVVDAGGGRPELLTVLPANARGLVLAAQPGGMAYLKYDVRSSIWRHDLTGARRAPERLITSGGLHAMPRYSPDGKSIAFMSDRSGGLELWVADASGRQARRLTDLRGEGGAPRWSPDGKRIAFDLRVDGQHRVLVVQAEGGVVTELVGDSSENGAPSWSGDGQWVYFGSNRSGEPRIWRVSVRGGMPQQISRGMGMIAYETPDGRAIYYAGPRERPGIFRVGLGAGAEEETVVAGYRLGYLGMWELVRDGVCYLQLEADRPPELRLKPYSGGAAKTVAVLPMRAKPAGYSGGLTIWHPFSVSPDGGSLLMTQLEERRSNIMVAEGPGR